MISCQGLSKKDLCFEGQWWLWKREPWVMGRPVRWGLHWGWALDLPASLSTCEVCPGYHFQTQTGFHLFIPTNWRNGLSFSKSYLLVLINFSCITKNNRLDFFNHRNLFLTILEAGSPRSRCHHDHSFSVDSGLQRAILCLCLHIVFCVCMCVGGDRNEASF